MHITGIGIASSIYLKSTRYTKNCGISIFEGLDSLLVKDSIEIEHPSLAVEGDDRALTTDRSRYRNPC